MHPGPNAGARQISDLINGLNLGLWLGSLAIIASLLFGALHFWGGPIYMLLLAIAGILYGWSYQRAGLEGAIASHFLLHAVHFFLFSYPALT